MIKATGLKNGYDEKKQGILRINFKLLLSLSFEARRLIFESLLIIEATNHFWNDEVVYKCFSPLFKSVPLGERIPEYLVEVKTKKGKVVDYKFINPINEYKGGD